MLILEIPNDSEDDIIEYLDLFTKMKEVARLDRSKQLLNRLMMAAYKHTEGISLWQRQQINKKKIGDSKQNEKEKE